MGDILKALILYSSYTNFVFALSKACEELLFQVTYAENLKNALKEFDNNFYDIVIIETNHHNKEEVKILSSFLKKNEEFIKEFLESGINKFFVETPNITYYLNELIQLKYSIVLPFYNFATNQILCHATLDESNDLIQITDSKFIIKYLNKKTEQILGYKKIELKGKNIFDILFQVTENSDLTQTLNEFEKWEGTLNFIEKSKNILTLHSKILQITYIKNSFTNFVFITSPLKEISIVRNSSLKNFLQEMPRFSNRSKSISDAINILNKLDEQLNPSQSKKIDEVIRLIKSFEYNSISNLFQNPKIESETVKGLLETNTEEKLRKPFLNKMNKEKSKAKFINELRPIDHDSLSIKDQRISFLFDRFVFSWDFDIFQIEMITNNKPLLSIGMYLFSYFNVAATLGCDLNIIHNWLIAIESNYRKNNFYHNSTHAADVVQATAYFLKKDRIANLFEPLDNAIVLIAAAAHDLDHFGKTNAYLCNLNDQLAILYNDVSVLENHHVAFMFQLTLENEQMNIFKNLDKNTYKLIRHSIIEIILATDMAKHFEQLTMFIDMFNLQKNQNKEDEIDINILENISLIKRIMIKCADISNPTRSLPLCLEWSIRIAEEYLKETEYEKKCGLPIVLPMFDRQNCFVQKAQIDFIDYVIKDLVEIWDYFVNAPELMVYLRKNYMMWKQIDKENISNFAEFKNYVYILKKQCKKN